MPRSRVATSLARGVYTSIPGRALLKAAHATYAWGFAALTFRHPFGTNVFDKDWDALVLLDCCRVDALREVTDEYDFLNTVGAITSVGSTSAEWVAKTFTTGYRSEIENTAYVSANLHPETVLQEKRYTYPHTERPMQGIGFSVVDPEDFLVLEQVWKHAPDEYRPYGAILPEYVTDRAINVARAHEPDRLIVHYIQPHQPYDVNALRDGREPREHEAQPWRYLRENGGEEVFRQVWEAYLDQLRFVLDDVAVLLRNIDADTVAISADHGEGFGEWGVYGHPQAAPSPYVKRVPWALTSATDSGEYQPRFEPDERKPNELDEQLEALGYASPRSETES